MRKRRTRIELRRASVVNLGSLDAVIGGGGGTGHTCVGCDARVAGGGSANSNFPSYCANCH